MIDLVRDINAILRIDLDRWRAIASLGRNTLDHRPEPGEWSALECLIHAADTEALFGHRMRAILDGAETFPAFDPDTQSTPVESVVDAADVVERLERRRTINEAILGLITEADLERGSRHAELGPVTLRQLVNEYPAHDLMHLVQAERAMMQPYIRATGPWRHYFVQHDVSAEPG